MRDPVIKTSLGLANSAPLLSWVAYALLLPFHGFPAQLDVLPAKKESPWLLSLSTIVDILPLGTAAKKQVWIPAISMKIVPTLWSDMSPFKHRATGKDSIQCN